MKYAGMPMGMCVLMKELGLYDLTPALCHLDYTMSEAGGVTNFVRQYTLASGGSYCDCGYKKKINYEECAMLVKSITEEEIYGIGHAQRSKNHTPSRIARKIRLDRVNSSKYCFFPCGSSRAICR